ncbi:hypothetical protein [Citrobacter amalonaticus]|uniref:hypothetical protein n=1 Tax=Citrobacter amalonaticus TaxID=35703 RepID=UPI0020BF55AF|nr:hypothetical protein [Citrobacter amalonaticus]MCK8152388.1 hypothetical protein [Citrobacter amalonaticus]HBU6575460.1 hypothetical protein [Citrobacter amalonaticus]HCB1824158.1 hypothetical protein [Citrobacter amalonaticus]HCB1901631.1 hypothetical protein [Citrobacter amalonaticus]HCB3268582.1 hypothetical protein [Citrobacter amalonaticus]
MVKEQQGLLDLVAQNMWVFSLASIVLVFIGWAVTYNNSAKLATRSESKSLIDSLCKLVNDISDISIDYWLNKSQANKKSCKNKHGIRIIHTGDDSVSQLFIMNIFAKMNQAVKYIELLEGRGIKFDKKVLPMLLSKVTLDCEDAAKMTQAKRAARVQEILAISQDTMNHIYITFQNNHPPSRPFNIFKIISLKWEDIYKWYKQLS